MASTGIKYFGDEILVTGLAASGTTDGTGTWNLGVNIATILAAAEQLWPTAANTVIVRVTNGDTAMWGGVRTNGKTTAVMHRSMIIGNEDNFVPVPVNGATPLVDFYAQSVTGGSKIEFRIRAAWVGFNPYDIDGALPTVSPSVLGTKTITEVPANSTLLVRVLGGGLKWCPTAETVVQTNNLSGFQLIKVDAAKQVKINATTASMLVYGHWDTADVTWESWRSSPVTPTIDSAWHLSPFVKAGKKGVFGYHDESTTGTRHDARPLGSSRAVLPAGVVAGSYNGFTTALDVSGQSEYWVETGATGNLYYIASFDEYTGSSAAVSMPPVIKHGDAVTLVPSGYAGALTSITLTDANSNTLTLPITANAFNYPAMAGATDGLLFGALTASVTDGTSSAPTGTTLQPVGYDEDPPTNVVFTVNAPSDNGYSIFSLAQDLEGGVTIVNGDQIYYPTAFGTVFSEDTNFETNADEFTLYLIRAVNGDVWEFIWHAGAETSSAGHLTIVMRGISMEMIKMRGITMRGI